MIWNRASRLESVSLEKPISFDHYVIGMLDGLADQINIILERQDGIMEMLESLVENKKTEENTED